MGVKLIDTIIIALITGGVVGYFVKYFLDLDYQTISDILKIPLGTVKSRISIGLKNLKESLGGDEIERS